MKTKNIVIENLKNLGLFLGKGIPGKGTEIFETSRRVSFRYIRENKKERDDNISKMLEQIEKAGGVETTFINQIQIDGRSYYYEDNIEASRKEFSIKKLIESNFDGVKYIEIRREPKCIGYLSLNNYTSSFNDQKQLIEDAMAIIGEEVFGEWENLYYSLEYQDCVFEIKNTYNYASEHGPESFVQNTDECEYLNGRMNNYNDCVMDLSSADDYMKEYFNEIDPEEKISVYHRKGKDWYFGYSLDTNEIYLTYRDEDGELVEEEYFTFYVITPDEELLKKIIEAAKSIKEDLEIRSFVNNELKIGNFDNYYINQGLANMPAVKLVFEDDPWTLREEILESLGSWKLENIAEEFSKAYMKAMNERVTLEKDKNIKINGESYKHLKIIDLLGKRFNYKLVHSSVSSSMEQAAWAIKKDSEEYHFDSATC